MKHRVSSKAICPYYKHEDPQMVYCEGISTDSVIHVAFSSRGTSLQHKKTCCQADWHKCPVAMMHDKRARRELH